MGVRAWDCMFGVQGRCKLDEVGLQRVLRGGSMFSGFRVEGLRVLRVEGLRVARFRQHVGDDPQEVAQIIGACHVGRGQVWGHQAPHPGT